MPILGKPYNKQHQESTPHQTPEFLSESSDENPENETQTEELATLPRDQWPLKAFCTVKPIHGETFKARKKKKTPINTTYTPVEMEDDQVYEQMQVVDGKIVMTDIRAQHAQHVDEKDEYINEKSFQKKNNRVGWSKVDSIKFYKLLSLLGTDFGLIAGALTNKTRIQVRNKFKVEERKNPILIEKCLSRRDFIDTKEFAKYCGCNINDIEKFKGIDIPVPTAYYKVLLEKEKEKEKEQVAIDKPVLHVDEGIEIVGQVDYSSE